MNDVLYQTYLIASPTRANQVPIKNGSEGGVGVLKRQIGASWWDGKDVAKELLLVGADPDLATNGAGRVRWEGKLKLEGV